MGKADVIDYDEANRLHGLRRLLLQGPRSGGRGALADPKDLGVSHGYEYGETDLQQDGSYRSYRTFEISPLPRHRAANTTRRCS
jgi:hypothetical protein